MITPTSSNRFRASPAHRTSLLTRIAKRLVALLAVLWIVAGVVAVAHAAAHDVSDHDCASCRSGKTPGVCASSFEGALYFPSSSNCELHRPSGPLRPILLGSLRVRGPPEPSSCPRPIGGAGCLGRPLSKLENPIATIHVGGVFF